MDSANMERIVRTDGECLDALMSHAGGQNPILLQQQLWSAEKFGLSGGASSIYPMQAVLQSYTNAGNGSTLSHQLLYSSRDSARLQLSKEHYATVFSPRGNKQIHLSNNRSNPTNTAPSDGLLPCAAAVFEHNNAAISKIAEFHEFRHSYKSLEDLIPCIEANTSTYVKESTPEIAPKPSPLHSTAAVNGSPRLSSGNTSTGSCKPQISGKTKRKMQEKKTVCVPLSKGTGRPSGEGHSSDMWAWRKYGQKPIKGSPYPRGYYRCSSCKGCSAKKQVEISRNDPSMLIITYTSEHNHQAPRATTHNHFNPSPPASKQLHTTTEEKLNISEQEEATSFAEAFQNPFCSIISSSAMHLDPVTIDAVITRREPSADMKMICSISNANCWSTSQDLEEFFAELEELPESSTIFERAVIDGKASDDEAIDGSVITSDACKNGHHLAWSSSNSNVNSMVNT